MRTAELHISFRNVPLTVECEYDPGEPAIYWPTDRAHPGCAPEAILIACKAGEVDVLPLLDEDSASEIESVILAKLQG